MDDIMVTLSADPQLRSPNIEKEAEWAKREGSLYYPLGANRPLRSSSGCWIYFIREGKMVARARIEGFFEWEELPKPLFTYTGERESRRRWWVKYGGFALAKRSISHKGFQGFRYIARNERAKFARSF